MIEFNKQLWKERAADRCDRAADKPRAKRQRSRDDAAIERLAVVVDWCRSKHIEVMFGKIPGGSYNAIEKTIRISCRSLPEKQLHMLLHECGHHLIGFDEADERFGMGYPYVEDPNINTTFHHRIACLEEEIEAWNRGWKLAKRLDLDLSRHDFDRVRLECLRTYVKWAAGRRLLTTE